MMKTLTVTSAVQARFQRWSKQPDSFARELAQILRARLGKASLQAAHSCQEKLPKIQINKGILANTQAAMIDRRSEDDLFLRPDDVVSVE
jgi:hypothetical protein